MLIRTEDIKECAREEREMGHNPINCEVYPIS